MRRFGLSAAVFFAFIALMPASGVGADPKEVVGKDGALMVLIPAGEFLMGSTREMIDEWSRLDDCGIGKQCDLEDEFPQHHVTLDAFLIDKFEVTNAQYMKLVKATGHRVPVSPKDSQDPSRNLWNGKTLLPGSADLPVVNVDWHDAKAYCEWAGKRLPTEAEWEKAARGTDGRVFPWGASWNRSRLNSASLWANQDLMTYDAWASWWDAKGFELLDAKTLAGVLKRVGSFTEGASPYGAQDMAGNVSEWVSDWAGPDYYKASPERNPTGPDSGERRGIRGGSWYNQGHGARVALRRGAEPTYRGNTVGFRCAQDAP